MYLDHLLCTMTQLCIVYFKDYLILLQVHAYWQLLIKIIFQILLLHKTWKKIEAPDACGKKPMRVEV